MLWQPLGPISRQSDSGVLSSWERPRKAASVLAPSKSGLAVKKKRKLSPSPQQTSVGFLALPLLIMLIDLRPRNVILNIFPFGENHKRQRLAEAMVSTKVFNLSP